MAAPTQLPPSWFDSASLVLSLLLCAPGRIRQWTRAVKGGGKGPRFSVTVPSHPGPLFSQWAPLAPGETVLPLLLPTLQSFS